MSRLPTVSSSIPPDLRAFLDRVREILSTNGLDRYVTAKELVRSGIAGATPNGVITTPIDGTTVEYPPTPTGLAASGALANIILTWDPIRYKGHAYTEIWASGTNDLSTAVMIGQAPGTVYVDNVGAAATKYYWVRFVNQLGNIGEYNATVGVTGTTGTDPAYVLDLLTGSITESELYSELNSRINLIDGVGTLAQYSATTTYQIGDTVQYSGRLYRCILASTNNLPTNTTYWQDIGQYASFGNALAVQRESITTNATAIAAEVTAREALSVVVDGKNKTYRQTTAPSSGMVAGDLWFDSDDNNKAYRYNGTTWVATDDTRIAQNSADIITEQTVRANADSALSSSVSTLQTTVNGNTAAISTNTSSINGIRSIYSVKMDINGNVSGFGLMSTLVDGGAVTSDFFVNANRFAVTAPMTAVPLRVNSTAYTVNQAVRISGTTDKILICKVGGTSGGSAPSIAGAVGTLVTDGTVTWQIASSVPFAVLTSSATLNGNTLAPGVYIDGASIVNATINSAQIGSLTADKITTGTLGAGVIYAGSIQANQITAATLSALSVNTGSLTVNGALTLNSSAHIKGGQTGYNTGTGFFLGYDSTAYKFSIGNATTNMTWDGSALAVTGGTITGGTIRTAAFGTRVELSSSDNTLKVYSGTNVTIQAGGTGIGSVLKVTGDTPLGPSIWGTTTGAAGVYGDATTGYGVNGNATGSGGYGVVGSASGLGGHGVVGMASSASGYGVVGFSSQYEAIRGQAGISGGANHGVRGINTGNGSAGLVGPANAFDFYADGTGTNYGPFTGTHDALTELTDTFTVGDIVVDTQVVRRNGVSSAITLVKSSTIPNQKAVLGIVCAEPHPLSDNRAAVYVQGFEEDPETHEFVQVLYPYYESDCQIYNIMAVNALGEGHINVCGEGGDIQAGDLIVTSSTLGKGMKQADDIVRAITVAKARESVTFSSPTEVKQIACIYLCG